MHFSTILLMISLLVGWGAQALDCEGIYRKAYVDYSRTGDSALSEAQMIYLIYFDYSNNLEEAYEAAAPIFNTLKVNPNEEPVVLEKLWHLMKSGKLCYGNQSKTLQQIISYLK